MGMFLPAEGPETQFITLALTVPGVTTPPASFDDALADANTIVLNMAKCLDHKPCNPNVFALRFSYFPPCR